MVLKELFIRTRKLNPSRTDSYFFNLQIHKLQPTAHFWQIMFEVTFQYIHLASFLGSVAEFDLPHSSTHYVTISCFSFWAEKGLLQGHARRLVVHAPKIPELLCLWIFIKYVHSRSFNLMCISTDLQYALWDEIILHGLGLTKILYDLTSWLVLTDCW